MGSILAFLLVPAPLGDGADDRLAAGLHRDVLDPDHLLAALAAVPVERVGERRERAHQPVAVAQAQLAAGEGLLGQGGPAESFHAASCVATICAPSMASITSRAPMSDSRRRVALSRISLVSASSLLPRQIVPRTWLAA